MTNDLTLADLETYDPRARRGGKWRRFLCPLCGDQHEHDAAHRSLSLVVESGKWVCHRCKATGRLIEFREDAPQRDKRPVQRRRYMPRVQEAPDTEQVQKYRDMAPRIVPLLGTPAVDYLAQRRIPQPIARKARVKYCPDWGAAGRAVIFPIIGSDGKPIAAQGRSIDGDDKITYGPRAHGVFATAGALEANPVAICEAPIDALTLAYMGLPAVALCGCGGFPQWLGVLFGKVVKHNGLPQSRTVLIATDADEAGDNAAESLADALSRFGARSIRFRVQGAKDVNELLVWADCPLALSEQVDAACFDAGFGMPTRPDPRFDLATDSARWLELFDMTTDDEELQGALRGFRANGARLINGEITIDEHSDWGSIQDFDHDYEYHFGGYHARLEKHMGLLKDMPL